MIDFSKLNIDNNKIEEIKKIGNSCGVISCYLLSLIFDFNFNIDEFQNIGVGMTAKQVQDYAEENGVNYMSKESEGGKSNCSFADYDVLLENNILIDLSATNLNGRDRPHTSILTEITGDYFNPIFADIKEGIKQFSKLENNYLTFFYQNDRIRDFVQFS